MRLPGEDFAIHQRLLQWLDTDGVHPRIVGEFDDSAMMKAFGQSGAGRAGVRHHDRTPPASSGHGGHQQGGARPAVCLRLIALNKKTMIAGRSSATQLHQSLPGSVKYF